MSEGGPVGRSFAVLVAVVNCFEFSWCCLCVASRGACFVAAKLPLFAMVKTVGWCCLGVKSTLSSIENRAP